MQHEGPDSSRITRRQMLGALGAASVAGTGTVVLSNAASLAGDDPQPRPDPPAGPGSTRPTDRRPGRWSDPATWGGTLPTPDNQVVISRPVLLDTDARVAGMLVRPGGELAFDPEASHTLSSSRNVEVQGTLRMRPASSAAHHTLQFVDVDESLFRGGHADRPIDGDVGLWVTGGGVLDVAGAPKVGWARLTMPAPAGTMLIAVEDTTGWEAGDQVVITPTESPEVDGHWTHHDLRTITAIAGDQLALDRPLSHPHPAVTVREGVTHHAEVLNLTRNVHLTGTPGGRSHVIFLHNDSPQHMSHAELRHLGPRQGQEAVEGRYGLHFHLCGDGSRGSRLEGLVARECGNHAFVTHTSHGVSLRECVSHDTYEDPFWWDNPVTAGLPDDGIPTDDLLYERCVAHDVKTSPGTRYFTSGFFLGAGRGNVARECVAVGIRGDARSASGFHWPEHSKDANTWVFEDNLAHNLERSGIYFWQNVVPRTIVDRFTAYHCATGIFAGAYSNLVSYRDCTLYACGEQGLLVSAVPDRPRSHPGETITYERVHVDQAHLTDFAVEVLEPAVGSDRALQMIECTFRGGNVAPLRFTEQHGNRLPRAYELVGCTFEGGGTWEPERVPPGVVLRVK